ncbi:MAG: Asp23/Gls24 family envelope stress response protein [Clostridia bacterium]|nr:Asp23/Gls24 family envelope stress response protein [Clostridia bacterium]
MSENTNYIETGSVNISDEVIQSIAAMAVAETKGAALYTTLADGIVEKIVKKNSNKSVRIEAVEKNVVVEVHIVVDYGVKIQEVAAELQENIKRNIETMTDLTVTHVDVCVEGIIPESKKKDAANEEAEN